ncbi:DUF4270 family protein [Xanthovirga aplysinae]|uniref:DUF4270 family protein n=1 Tax=Xanthovirga aplysinae TaxID=2529853 RepID=UPI0016571A44|nr:DUF4270 family protein [Xanthovirga aplysinae]
MRKTKTFWTLTTTSIMNLLIKRSSLLLILAISFFSCEKFSEVGSGLTPENPGDIQFKRLSINPQVIIEDSISTNGRQLAGSYVDPIFGSVKATTFTQIGLPSDVAGGIPDDATFESARLVLQLDSLGMYGEFPSTQTVSVYELTEDLVSGEDFIYDNVPGNNDTIFVFKQYYGFDRTPYDLSGIGSDPQSIGVVSEENPDSVVVSLNDDFGQKLFDDIQNNRGGILDSQTKLNKGYKGLAITSEGDNILSFYFPPLVNDTLTSYLIVDYKNVDGELESFQFELGTDKVLSYSNIEVDRGGTPLANASFEPFLPDDGKLALQDGTGVGIHVDLSEFKKVVDSLDQIDQQLLISNAVLKLESVETAEEAFMGPAPSLSFLFLANDGQKKSFSFDSKKPNYAYDDNWYINSRIEDHYIPALLDYSSEEKAYEGSITLFLEELAQSSDPESINSDFVLYPLALDVQTRDLYGDGRIRVVDGTFHTSFFSRSLSRFRIKPEDIKLEMFYRVIDKN